MRGGRVIEWRNSTGSPTTVGDTTVTPLARSLIARWPGGGAVWSGPAGIIVAREGRTDRIPVVNVNRRILWGLRLGALALIATWMARDRRRKNSNG
jgi:hypothetical protein